VIPINMIHVKILFEFKNAINDEYGIESAWAVPEGLYYRIDNILFYASEYSLGDIVNVEDRKGELFVIELIKESGHSTVRIVFYDINDVVKTREYLKNLGCESEISDIPTLIAVDIPPNVDYKKIKAYLEDGTSLSKWGYEEACIAHNT